MSALVFKYLGADGNYRLLGVDCLISATPSAMIDLPAHPIEQRSSVVDHVIRKPKELQLEILQTDFPFTNSGGATLFDGLYNDTLADGVFGNEVSTTVSNAIDISNSAGAPGRHVSFVQELEWLSVTGTPLEVLYKFGPLKNMVIVSVVPNVGSNLLDATRVTVTLREVQFAALAVEKYKKPKIQQAKPKKDLGTQSPQETTPAEAEKVEKQKAFTATIFDKVRGR